MIQNQGAQNAWNQFAHSGKIDDYLAYCQLMQEQQSPAAKGAVVSGATDTRRDRPAAVHGRKG